VLITGLAGTGRSRAFLAELIACRFVMGGTQTMEADMGVGRGVLLDLERAHRIIILLALFWHH
jgi:hypothetical protein